MSALFSSINAYILGGGKSERFKEDKAFLKHEGRCFIDIVIESVGGLFGGVFLVGREYDHTGLDGCFNDEASDIGPLGGIYTALKKTDSSMNFFIGIDLPYIDRDVVISLTRTALQMPETYSGLIPVLPDGPHPLFAFYGKPCLSAARRCISNQCYRVQCMGSYCTILYHEITRGTPSIDFEKWERSFTNVNSYADYIGLREYEKSPARPNGDSFTEAV